MIASVNEILCFPKYALRDIPEILNLQNTNPKGVFVVSILAGRIHI